MPRPRNDAASGSEAPTARIAALGAEIEELAERKRAVEAEIKRLRVAEDPAAGIFHHQEIFSQSQEKLVLEVEMDLRRKKIRRLELGYAEDAVPQAGPGLGL